MGEAYSRVVRQHKACRGRPPTAAEAIGGERPVRIGGIALIAVGAILRFGITGKPPSSLTENPERSGLV